METSEEYQKGGARKHRTGYFSPGRRAARKRKRKTRRYNRKKGVFCTENDTSPDCTDPISAKTGGVKNKKIATLKSGGFLEPSIEEI